MEKHFVTEEAYKVNHTRQIEMVSHTIAQLRKHGVNADTNLKLEYFFFTNRGEKAEALALALELKAYSVEFGVSASDESIFVVTGWTTPMKMEGAAIEKWTGEMVSLGYKYDSEFDGWGTTPDQ